MPRVAVDRYVFAGKEVSLKRRGLDLFLTDGDDTQQALWLGTVVCVIVFARVDQDAQVPFEVTDFGSIERQFVPTGHRWLKVIVEVGVVVPVVRARPRVQQALLVIPYIDVVGFVTVLDRAGCPALLCGESVPGQSDVQHLVGRPKVRVELFSRKHDATIRIEPIGTAVLGNLVCDIQADAEQIVKAVHELVPADTSV